MISFYESAIAALQRARELAPRDRTYALELATALDALKRFDQAERVFREAMELDPRSHSLRRYYEGHLKAWSRARDGAAPQPSAPSEA